MLKIRENLIFAAECLYLDSMSNENGILMVIDNSSTMFNLIKD